MPTRQNHFERLDRRPLFLLCSIDQTSPAVSCVRFRFPEGEPMSVERALEKLAEYVVAESGHLETAADRDARILNGRIILIPPPPLDSKTRAEYFRKLPGWRSQQTAELKLRHDMLAYLTNTDPVPVKPGNVNKVIDIICPADELSQYSRLVDEIERQAADLPGLGLPVDLANKLTAMTKSRMWFISAVSLEVDRYGTCDDIRTLSKQRMLSLMIAVQEVRDSIGGAREVTAA